MTEIIQNKEPTSFLDPRYVSPTRIKDMIIMSLKASPDFTKEKHDDPFYQACAGILHLLAIRERRRQRYRHILQSYQNILKDGKGNKDTAESSYLRSHKKDDTMLNESIVERLIAPNLAMYLLDLEEKRGGAMMPNPYCEGMTKEIAQQALKALIEKRMVQDDTHPYIILTKDSTEEKKHEKNGPCSRITDVGLAITPYNGPSESHAWLKRALEQYGPHSNGRA